MHCTYTNTSITFSLFHDGSLNEPWTYRKYNNHELIYLTVHILTILKYTFPPSICSLGIDFPPFLVEKLKTHFPSMPARCCHRIECCTYFPSTASTTLTSISSSFRENSIRSRRSRRRRRFIRYIWDGGGQIDIKLCNLRGYSVLIKTPQKPRTTFQ